MRSTNLIAAVIFALSLAASLNLNAKVEGECAGQEQGSDETECQKSCDGDQCAADQSEGENPSASDSPVNP